MNEIALSLVVPAYNERESLPGLLEETLQQARRLSRAFELIVVDDGSTDGTWDVIEEFAAKNAEVTGVRLARNFGQTAAMSAGFERAKGRVIGCLDADGQNDPADLAGMLRKLEEGYDVVSGWRVDRKDPASRRAPSCAANSLISFVTGVKLHDYGCTLKLYKAEYLRAIRLFGEMHRFAPAFAGSLGARITEHEVNHRPRRHGASKYGLGRTFKVLLDLVTVKFMDAYLTKPIYFFGGSGVLLGLTGVALAGVTLYKKLAHGVFVKDQPLFLVSIFLALVGIQMLALGVLAEILIRVYHDIGRRPTYFVRETAGHADRAAAA